MGSAEHKGCTRITPSAVCNDSQCNCYHHCFLATGMIWWFVTNLMLFFCGRAPWGVVKSVSVHFHLHTKRPRSRHFPSQAAVLSLLIVYQIFLLIFPFSLSVFLGVGRTVWRVRVQQPLFLTSWSEHDSWRASIWNSTKSQAHCCPSACGTAPFFSFTPTHNIYAFGMPLRQTEEKTSAKQSYYS